MKLINDGYGTSGTSTLQPRVEKINANLNLLDSEVFFDSELEIFENGGDYISPKWSYEFVHEELPLFLIYSTERYKIIQDESDIDISQLEEIIKTSYEKFIVDARYELGKYGIYVTILPVSQECVEQSAQQLHHNLLSLHEPDKK